MKKVTIILGILLFLCVALQPIEVKAETEGYLTYTITDGEVTITDCDEDAAGKIVIPDAIEGYPVTGIVEFAFSECNALTGISIPASVTNIPDGAFRETRGLTGIWVAKDNPVYASDSKGVLYSKDMKKVLSAPLKLAGTYTVADGTTEIGKYAFFSCASVTKVNIPETVTKIGLCAFSHCTSLKTANIPASVTDLDAYVFSNCSSLESAVIPEGITVIKISMFDKCKALRTVTIPESVTEIGTFAFAECESLTGICLSNVKTIGTGAFTECKNLTAVTLGEGLTQIHDSAFQNAEKLASIILPESLIELCDGAFWGCSSLKSIRIPAGVTTMGSLVFAQCRALEEILVDPANPNYVCDDYGVLYNKDMTTLMAAPRNLSGTYTVADSVTEIEGDAFSYVKNLEAIVMPESITRIGSYAFTSCDKLTHVTIPQGVTVLESVFYHCTGLTSVKIPEGVTQINAYAFGECVNLEHIEIPSSVTQIGFKAFVSCLKLREVIYYGTDQQWNAIKIDVLNDCLVNATRTYHVCDWGTGEITAQPTCKQEGWKKYTCSGCGMEKTVKLNTLDHEPEETWSVDESKHWRACKNCDYKQNWVNHAPGPAATEDAPQTCTVCGYEIAPKLQKEEPTYWIWIVVGAVLVAGGVTAAVIILKKKRQ